LARPLADSYGFPDASQQYLAGKRQGDISPFRTLDREALGWSLSIAGSQPAAGAYVDAQQGWLYVYTNFNSVRFSTDPAGELTMAAGLRPTLGPFEFDIGAEYYYYPGEIGPEHSNYWEGTRRFRTS